MDEWVRCTQCELQHARRPDGRCPGCGAPIRDQWTAAPAPSGAEALATVLVQPGAAPEGQWPVALAPAPAGRPRVWTAFTAFGLSQVASVGVAAIVASLVASSAAIRSRGSIDAPTVQRLVFEPAALLSMFALTAITSAAIALAAGKMGRESVRHRLGLERGSSGGRWTAFACVGGLGLTLAYEALTTLANARPSGASALIERALSAATGPGSHRWAMFLFNLVTIAILAPVGEELLYRGYIQRRLVQRWGALAGILVTSGLFALAHFDRLQSPFALAIGGMLGWITVRAGSIRPALVAHATVNGWGVLASAFVRLPRSPAPVVGQLLLGVAILAFAVWQIRRAGGAAPSTPPPTSS